MEHLRAKGPARRTLVRLGPGCCARTQPRAQQDHVATCPGVRRAAKHAVIMVHDSPSRRLSLDVLVNVLVRASPASDSQGMIVDLATTEAQAARAPRLTRRSAQGKVCWLRPCWRDDRSSAHRHRPRLAHGDTTRHRRPKLDADASI